MRYILIIVLLCSSIHAWGFDLLNANLQGVVLIDNVLTRPFVLQVNKDCKVLIQPVTVINTEVTGKPFKTACFNPPPCSGHPDIRTTTYCDIVDATPVTIKATDIKGKLSVAAGTKAIFRINSISNCIER